MIKCYKQQDYANKMRCGSAGRTHLGGRNPGPRLPDFHSSANPEHAPLDTPLKVAVKKPLEVH